MRIRQALAALLYLALAAFSADDLPIPFTVPTTNGPVTGYQPVLGPDSCIRFLGIPYAKPPVGERRWKAPEKPDPWTAPLKCNAFSKVCPQPTLPIYGDLGPASEDCLYLNVWTAGKVTTVDNIDKFADEKRPVLFWIHGGGFAIGAASQEPYKAWPLAQDGAVVVTFNYRLGPFGFLAHPALSAESPAHTSGNYGLMDMLLALHWVHDNIANFGGDPNNVTLWGESAGGAAVEALMASPQAKGLFHKAIVMSSNTGVELRYLNKPNGALQSMEDLGLEFQKRLNVADGPDALKEMRAKSPEELMKAARPGSAVPGVSTTDSIIVDGNVLLEPIKKVFAEGRMANVPVLYGNVADEGTLFERKSKIDTLAKYKEFLDKRYAAKSAQAFQIYPAADDAAVQPALALLFADIFFETTRTHARQLAAVQPNTFVYHFTRKAKPMIDSKWDVYHGSEVPFFFGTVTDPEKYSDADRELSRQIRIYLLAFAKTGNPNGDPAPRAPDWPAYKLGEEKHIILDTPISTGDKLHAKTLDALIELEK
ncbi:MAG TPA: carboxylesterase family protein [Planctomycetota bacterium]|nr:carboxylesterase family protein [Planctomycetota bacterium]